MTHDRHLIETIKTHFARKSSGQLQAIVMFDNQERWSPEAIAAAREVLEDRIAGRAQEPEGPEEEDPLPPPSPVDGTMILLLSAFALGGLAGGFLVRPILNVMHEGRPDPDLPVPFGPRMAWLALDTTDTQAVAAALGLRKMRSATWVEGIEGAHQAAIFVTPPLADWTLVASTALLARDRVEAAVKPLLVGLSRQFGDAQYFCTHRDVELHVWARARRGQLVRGYGWLGEKHITFWDEGKQTKEERDLGFQFINPESICELPKVGWMEKREIDTRFSARQTSKGERFPDETCVLQLASLWSVDPTTLDEYFKEPSTGLLGNVVHGESRDAV